METKQDGHIVMVLSNKGYVALENNQIFQLWKRKCLKDIYTEIQFRYPNYKISLASLERIDFNNVVKVCRQFVKQEKQTKTLSILETKDNSKPQKYINLNKAMVTGINKMKATKKVKAKAVAVIGINITAGVLHLGFQSMADLVCYSEAKIIDKLNVFDKTVEEIMNARIAKTKEAQQTVLKSPNKAKQSARIFTRLLQMLIVMVLSFLNLLGNTYQERK
jgi:hypothetical protein